MDKIKQNPKKILGIVAGVLFLAAILFMLLPGVVVSSNNYKIYTSLFGLTFGGKLLGDLDIAKEGLQLNSAINPLNLVSFILLILAIVGLVILIVGMFKDKLNKKTIIALTCVILVLVIVSAILTFACKALGPETIARGYVNSLVDYAKKQGGDIPTQEEIDAFYKDVLENLKRSRNTWSLGAGAIVSPIMMLLGACSLTGVICLSAKEAK